MPERSPTLRRAICALGLGLTLTLSGAACGNDDTDTSTRLSTTQHNDADVAFASDMLRHHAQALSMVDLTRDRTLSPEVQRLAEQIQVAQAPEIETFAKWLTNWDEEVPETMRDHTNAGHDMDDMSGSMDGMDADMPGMMTADDLEALETASNARFESLWLEMMIEHHRGAVEMADTEREDGQFKAAVALAGDIVESQTAQVETMQGLLDS